MSSLIKKNLSLTLRKIFSYLPRYLLINKYLLNKDDAKIIQYEKSIRANITRGAFTHINEKNISYNTIHE